MRLRHGGRQHSESRHVEQSYAAADREPRVGVTQRLVGGAERYPTALDMRQRLCAQGLTGDRVTVVGRDLTAGADKSGALSRTLAAVRGAVPGLLIGALIGWLLPVIGVVTADMSAVWLTTVTALLGTVLGAVIAILGDALSAAYRPGEERVQARRFDLLVDADCADHAARVLGQIPGDTPATEPSVTPQRPA